MLPGPVLIIACPKCDFLMAKETIQSGNTFGARWWSNGKVDAPMLPNYPKIARCGGCRAFFWVEDVKVKEKIPCKKYYEMDREGRREKLPQLKDFKKGWKEWDREKTDKEPLEDSKPIEKKKETTPIEDSKAIKGKKKQPPWVEGLTIKELNRAINKGLAKTKEKELYLRNHLWWAANEEEIRISELMQIYQWREENRDASEIRIPVGSKIEELLHTNQILFHKLWEKSGKGYKKLEGLSKKAASIEKIKHENLIGLEALLDETKPEDRIMKAEIKRQSGDFKEAVEYLSDLPEEYHWVSEQMKQEIEMENTKVFELKNKE
jgi:hypothetical protein